jgi:hypothetical protein
VAKLSAQVFQQNPEDNHSVTRSGVLRGDGAR